MKLKMFQFTIKTNVILVIRMSSRLKSKNVLFILEIFRKHQHKSDLESGQIYNMELLFDIYAIINWQDSD